MIWKRFCHRYQEDCSPGSALRQALEAKAMEANPDVLMSDANAREAVAINLTSELNDFALLQIGQRLKIGSEQYL